MKKIFRRRIKNFLIRNYTRIYGWFHKIEKKILFISFGGKQYSDNPRAISEKIHQLQPEYQLIWRLTKDDDIYSLIPNYIKIVQPTSLSFYKELATSKFFVTNEAIEPNVYKRKGQFFIQTWHGDRGFKKILYDHWDDQQKKRPLPIIDNDVTDLFVVGSEYGKQRSRDSFHYQKEFFCVGMPRNDKLLISSADEKVSIKEKLGIDLQKKILLYAPTFRDNEKQKIQVNLKTVIDHLNKKGDDKWICLLRAHSISKGFEMDETEKNNYIDVTDYPDMADILLISDILLTDYSSSSGDFILKDKPVILLHYDLEEYNAKHRNFRISPKDAGYFCVQNDLELVELIDNLTDEMAEAECKKVKEFFGVMETGRATELVCNRISEVIKENAGTKNGEV